MQDRVIALEGIHNFRDYGGYRARDGAMIRSGMLWRSGQHGEATAADLARVAELGLQTIIDLRGDSERVRMPCLRAENFGGVVLFADGETVHQHAPHEEARVGVTTMEGAHAAMRRVYTSLPYRPNLIRIFRDYFAALAERPGASLLHCVAGKDRTGIAAALLHTLLGVHPDDRLADYLLTNSAGNSERRIVAGFQAIRASFGADVPEAVIRTLMGVDASYLETAFAEMSAQSGSVEAYVETVLGVDAARRSAIEARLLV